VNPSKKIQLQHPKSEKCLCPSSSTSSATTQKRLRLKSCEQCDAGYGWTLDGESNRLIYSSGSSEQYCVATNQKKELLIDLCSTKQQEFSKFFASTHTIIQVPVLLPASGINAEPYRYVNEEFTDLNVE
jgi:hypothetical protein